MYLLPASLPDSTWEYWDGEFKYRLQVPQLNRGFTSIYDVYCFIFLTILFFFLPQNLCTCCFPEKSLTPHPAGPWRQPPADPSVLNLIAPATSNLSYPPIWRLPFYSLFSSLAPCSLFFMMPPQLLILYQHLHLLVNVYVLYKLYKDRDSGVFITWSPLPGPLSYHRIVHAQLVNFFYFYFWWGSGLNKLRSCKYSEKKEDNLRNAEKLILPDGVWWWRQDSKVPGHTCEAVVCSVAWLFCNHRFLRVLLWRPGSVSGVGGPPWSVQLLCRPRPRARPRPNRWSSPQHFSCLVAGSSLTSKLGHADPEHCDLWHNFLYPLPCSPSKEEGAQLPCTGFCCL